MRPALITIFTAEMRSFDPSRWSSSSARRRSIPVGVLEQARRAVVGQVARVWLSVRADALDGAPARR
jgi:hypothetical protein